MKILHFNYKSVQSGGIEIILNIVPNLEELSLALATGPATSEF